MKNGWTNFLMGYVCVILSGKGAERFVNECIRNSIPVWHVKRLKNEELSFFIRLKDVHALRPIARKNECKCRFGKKKGIPFLLKRTGRNIGFAIGFFLFLGVLFLLSNMIWSIEIQGAKPETEHLIKKELQRIGVKNGSVQFFIPNAEEIQKALSEHVKVITWVGVELNGTSYHLKVVEKNEPNQTEALSPGNIVAKKKAVITRMFVSHGKPLVMVNDHVVKGQLLVSGVIGTEKNAKVIASKAEIYGETWYRSSVNIPRSTNFNVYSGNSNIKHYITFGSLKVPVWGFGQKKFTQSVKEENQHDAYFLGWRLPISYIKETDREKEQAKRVYTAAEARTEGLKIGRTDVLRKIGGSGKIIGEKVLHQTNENGKVKMIILYQAIENIAKTTPIVQGD
ncbi:sporulation protein YqfD [Metabacillus sp. GX 13764]|uniref:sporulation protein YqfD n=1 Tax=Metabacillus kandeliae TaxID=2900151 RepID=UPI001E494F38|nr:sporulation protein YqfD [Metabacillus kandeliae]MCD7033054.1 sporulation protein YqfD [Metabacillus kandeliae]